ncbi:MAG: flavin reductase family protein [Gemmatimonadetes bacterium]|nr:flavin reductase family protein [Gemmatimonadota bacterium]
MASPELFRDAMANWAGSVTLIAARDEGAVICTTATSFIPVAADPPSVLVALSPNAQVLPFAEEGSPLGVTVLSQEQAHWASVFADPFPVGSPEWSGSHAPVIAGASVGLECTARKSFKADASKLVVCRVEIIHAGSDEPLLYHRRRYAGLADDDRSRRRGWKKR